jgi:hypothetical protein
MLFVAVIATEKLTLIYGILPYLFANDPLVKYLSSFDFVAVRGV